MPVDFRNSETKENLMRAFAGESQARNRYTFGAAQARRENQAAVTQVFLYTAEQEKEHAEIFYNHLKELAKETIHVDGSYPVDITDSLPELLRMAQHNEYEEHDVVYSQFARTAKEEGFSQISSAFQMIAEIERIHGDRFQLFADLLEKGQLFVSEMETGWMCLNCGFVYTGTSAPAVCPVCSHEQGYFIRLEMAPYIR